MKRLWVAHTKRRLTHRLSLKSLSRFRAPATRQAINVASKTNQIASLSLLTALTFLTPARSDDSHLDPKRLHADRIKTIDPKDPTAWISLANDCERWLLLEKRRDALRKAIAIDPNNAEARARLDESQALNGSNWGPADQMDAKEIKMMEAKGLRWHGSSWMEPKEALALQAKDRAEHDVAIETRIDILHFRIYSMLPLTETRRIGAILENTLQSYCRFHSSDFIRPDALETLTRSPLNVFLLKEADFQKWQASYCKARDLPPPNGVPSGIYTPDLRALHMAWSHEDTGYESLEATVAHEATHAMDHVLSASKSSLALAAQWIHEGRACHFGWAVQGRQVIPGAIKLPHGDPYLELVPKIGSIPLRALISTDKASFRDEHYIASWALVHFLYHGANGKYADQFTAFLSNGTQSRMTPEDFDRIIGNPETLEAPFKQHIKNVLIPAIQPFLKKSKHRR